MAPRENNGENSENHRRPKNGGEKRWRDGSSASYGNENKASRKNINIINIGGVSKKIE
jgi:hypothetical protein